MSARQGFTEQGIRTLQGITIAHKGMAAVKDSNRAG